MPITLTCPHCKHVGRAPDGIQGKTVRCSRCRGQFNVPVSPAPVSAIPLAVLPQTPIPVQPLSRSVPPAIASVTIEEGAPCPYCHNPLIPKPKKSRKCPHCGAYCYIRSGVLLTEADARRMDEKAGASTGLVTAKVAYKRSRKRVAEELRDARGLLRDGIAHSLRITMCEDDSNCAFCRTQHDKVIEIKACKRGMLPPFHRCENERARRTAREFGCRCMFSPILINLPGS